MKVALVNFANAVGWYMDGQARLIKSFLKHDFRGDYLAFTDEKQLGCPAHQEVPYAFKVYAIRKARELGYDLVFYGDASIYAVSSVNPIFQHIEEYGYYLEATEHNLGTWSHDALLNKLGLTRDEAFKIPTLVAGCIGFDFRQPLASPILNWWFDLAKDGVSFKGSWNNQHGEVSSDRRVKGHRHDQAALSGIAHLFKLKVLPFETNIFYATPPPARAVFHCHPTI